MNLSNITVDYITKLSTGELLIFYGFGIALLVLSIQIKVTASKSVREDSDIRLARYAGIYNFVKTVFNWGVFYFISAVLILISSIFSNDSSFFKPLLHNISFILATSITIFFTFAYIILVIKELLLTWLDAREYGL
jgi:hypothetical protein